MQPESLLPASATAARHLAAYPGAPGGAQVQQRLHPEAATPLKRSIHLCRMHLSTCISRILYLDLNLLEFCQ